MKKLSELGISPAPWRPREGTKVGGGRLIAVDSWYGSAGVQVARCNSEAEAKLISASPAMYEALWDICFGDGGNGTVNCRNCVGADMGYCGECRLWKARSALAEASE